MRLQLAALCTPSNEDEEDEDEDEDDGGPPRMATRKDSWRGAGGPAEAQTSRSLRKAQGAHAQIASHEESPKGEIAAPMWEL